MSIFYGDNYNLWSFKMKTSVWTRDLCEVVKSSHKLKPHILIYLMSHHQSKPLHPKRRLLKIILFQECFKDKCALQILQNVMIGTILSSIVTWNTMRFKTWYENGNAGRHLKWLRNDENIFNNLLLIMRDRKIMSN